MGEVRVRVANADDAAAVAGVHVDTTRETYRGLFPREHLDRIDPERRRRVWERHLRTDQAPTGTLVAEDPADGVVGFVHVSPSRDADTDPRRVGEIQAVYVRPSHWGRGAGRLLMAAGLRRLGEAGFGEVMLWVLEGNARARRFYEAGGWRADGAFRIDGSRGVTVTEIRYRWSGEAR